MLLAFRRNVILMSGLGTRLAGVKQHSDKMTNPPREDYLHSTIIEVLTATLKCTCNDSFTDVLRVVR